MSDPLFPNTIFDRSKKSDVNIEHENQTRQVAFDDIPDVATLAKIVQMYVNPTAKVKKPRSVWTWGSEQDSYNHQGSFRPSTPEMVGLQAKDLFSLLNPAYVSEKQQVEAKGTLGNELTHFFQNQLGMLDKKNARHFNEKLAPSHEQIVERNKEGRYDDSPFFHDKTGKMLKSFDNIEMQSTLINDIIRTIEIVKLHEAKLRSLGLPIR